MRWFFLRCLAFFVTILFIQEDWAAAAPNPSSEDMMRELLKIDQMYSSIARPRFGKRTQSKSRYVPGDDYDSQYQSEHDVGDWLTARR